MAEYRSFADQKKTVSHAEYMRRREKLAHMRSTVSSYFLGTGHALFCLTDDVPFANLIRNTIKEFGTNTFSRCHFSNSCKEFTYEWILDRIPCDELCKDDISNAGIVFCIERNLRDGGGTINLLRTLRDIFPEASFIGVDTEPSRETKMLLLESGCNEILAKPADVFTLLSALAFVMREPTPAELLFRRARHDIRCGNGIHGAKIASALVRRRPEDAKNYVLLGDALMVMEEEDKAKHAYIVATKKDEEYLEPLQRLVDLALKDENNAEALRILRKMHVISPLNGARDAQMAHLLIKEGDIVEASKLLEYAARRLDTVPETVVRDACLSLAKLAFRKGEFEIAERNVRKSLDLKTEALDAGDIAAFNLLGLSLRRQGRIADAIKEFRRALKIVPGASEILYNMALAFSGNFDFKSAVETMGEAMDNGFLDAAPAAACFNMGMLFLRAGKWDRAESCLARAVDLDPLLEKADAALSRIRESSFRNREDVTIRHGYQSST